MIFANPVKRWT